MRSFYLYGAVLASLTLVFYTAAIYLEKKHKFVTYKVIALQIAALAVNIGAVVMMSLESKQSIISSHGIIGYSSLVAITVNTVMTFRFYIKNGPYTRIPFRVRLYTTITYTWWLVAYISGGVLSIVR